MFVFNGWIPWILTVVLLAIIILVVRAVRQFVANQQAVIAAKRAATAATAAEIARCGKLAELDKKLATASLALVWNTGELAKLKPKEGATRVSLSSFDLGQIKKYEDSVATYTAKVKAYAEQIEALSSPARYELLVA